MGQAAVQPGGSGTLVPFARSAHHGVAEADQARRAARRSWRCCLGFPKQRRQAALAPAAHAPTGR